MNNLQDQLLAAHGHESRYGIHAVFGAAAGLLGHGVHAVGGLVQALPAAVIPYAQGGAAALLLAVGYGAWHAVRGEGASSFDRLKVLGVQAAFAAAAGVAGYGLPLHHGGHNHAAHEQRFNSDKPSPRDDAAVQARVQKLLTHAKADDLARWQARADQYGWTLKEFLENVCITQPAEAEATAQRLQTPAP